MLSKPLDLLSPSGGKGDMSRRVPARAVHPLDFLSYRYEAFASEQLGTEAAPVLGQPPVVLPEGADLLEDPPDGFLQPTDRFVVHGPDSSEPRADLSTGGREVASEV